MVDSCYRVKVRHIVFPPPPFTIIFTSRERNTHTRAISDAGPALLFNRQRLENQSWDSDAIRRERIADFRFRRQRSSSAFQFGELNNLLNFISRMSRIVCNWCPKFIRLNRLMFFIRNSAIVTGKNVSYIHIKVLEISQLKLSIFHKIVFKKLERSY